MKLAQYVAVLVCGLWALGAMASSSYQLSCLPASSDLALPEWIKARLDLHGWSEAAQNPSYRLCFRRLERQQIYADPGYPGNPYYPTWGAPPARVVTIPYLELSATGTDGAIWRAAQDLPQADSPAQSLQQALRKLIDQLPL